jgi:FAD/FMN-containing dehydrogenase
VTLTAAVADRLRAIVGPSHLLVDADLTAPYETDWTGRFIGLAAAVVRPGGTDEVAAVVRVCAEAALPITVQGGNTGLVGGATPTSGSVLISLTRLIGREPVDPIEAQVTVGAGVTLEALQRHARAAGLDFGVDLAARSAATVGGLVATTRAGSTCCATAACASR